MLKNWSKFNEKSEFKSTEEYDREELMLMLLEITL